MVRTSYKQEYQKAIIAMNEAAIERDNERIAKENAKYESFAEKRKAILENAASKEKYRHQYRTIALEAMLSTALKAIYIGALNDIDLLTPQSTRFCESRVDQFIEEQGGAHAVLSSMAGKNYLLSRIATIVEDAAEEADKETDDEEKAAETIPDKAKEDMFDQLDKEEDVTMAMDIITDRITSAEEEFIKKNSEDKQKIETIVNDINDRISAVKANDDMTEEEQDQAEEELEKESARLIADVYNNRPTMPLFEFMVRKNTDIVVKDPELKKAFQNESGKLDVDRIVDTTSYMYGFLEFVNTLGLQKIDSQYVQELAENLK